MIAGFDPGLVNIGMIPCLRVRVVWPGDDSGELELDSSWVTSNDMGDNLIFYFMCKYE